MSKSTTSTLVMTTPGAVPHNSSKLSGAPDESNAPPYRPRLLKLHKELVESASITGRENIVNEILIRDLQQHGFHAERQFLPQPETRLDSDSDRFNVIAWPIHSPPTRVVEMSRLLISAHLDTVPPFIPYSIDSGKVTNATKISGRGSVDAKASVAAQIVAVEQLLAEDLIRPGSVVLLYVVGEEEGGDGMRHFSSILNSPPTQVSAGSSLRCSQLPPTGFESVIFGEPTENKLARGHKGLLICNIKAVGKAGHSGYPWLGKSAIEVLMRALVRLQDEDLGSSEQFGETTVNVGTFQGGVGGNVIAEAASTSLVLRVATGPEGTGHEKVKKRLLQVLSEVDKDAFTVDFTAGYGAVPCMYDVEGFESTVVNFGTDAPVLAGPHKRYLYGPGSILVAHSDHEALTVGDLERAVEDYKRLILHALAEKA